jgi:hypothetical protein
VNDTPDHRRAVINGISRVELICQPDLGFTNFKMRMQVRSEATYLCFAHRPRSFFRKRSKNIQSQKTEVPNFSYVAVLAPPEKAFAAIEVIIENDFVRVWVWKT